MASVVIERMRQISSMTEPMCGKKLADLRPVAHYQDFWNPDTCGPKHNSFCPCNWAICFPSVNDGGIGWPFIVASFGFGSNVSRCDGPPAIVSQITRFAFWGKSNGYAAPVHFAFRCPVLRRRGRMLRSSDASATAPSPCAARPKEEHAARLPLRQEIAGVRDAD